MTKVRVKIIHAYKLVVGIGLFITCIAGQAIAGTLFVGADVEDFQGGFPAGSGMDRLGVVTTNGAIVDSSKIITTDFLINGMADADGKLLAGTPNANTLNRVAFNGTLLNSTNVSGIPNNDCCNEEMLFVPQSGGGSKFFHAHFSSGIRELDPRTGDLIEFSPITEVVGMALVNTDIWITRWAPREIGIWDPSTKVFDLVFDLDIVAPSLGNAGALAFDPGDEILWVGTQGGAITPFDLNGNILGESFQPFGSMPQTIDGLTFLGEVTLVPVPAAVWLFSSGLIGFFGIRRNKFELS